MPPGSQSSQSSLLKGLIKGTALYSVALFSQRIASLILLPVNTRYLGTEDYGILDLLEQIGVVVAVLIGLNLSAAMGYFYFKEESQAYRDKVVGTVMVGALLIGLAASIATALFVNPIGSLVFGTTAYRSYLLYVLILLPPSAALEALFTWLRVTDQPDVFARASLLRVALTISMTLIFVAGFKLRVAGVLTSSGIAIVFPTLLLGIYCLRRLPLTFDRTLFVGLFRFSFPIGLSSVAMFVINFGDRFLLRHYGSLSDVGVYAVAYKVGMMISLLHGSFHTYWYSRVYEVARRDDADDVIARIFTYMMLALSFALVALIVVCRPALTILITRPGFEKAVVIAPVIAIAYYFRAIGEFFRCFLLVEGRSSYDAACTWIGAVACIAAYFILIPPYGMWGAAAATLLTFLIIAAVSTVWAYRLRPFRVEGGRLLTLFAITASLLTVYYLAPAGSLLFQILWAVVLIAVFPALLWVLRFADPGEVLKLRSLTAAAIDRAHGMQSRMRS